MRRSSVVQAWRRRRVRRDGWVGSRVGHREARQRPRGRCAAVAHGPVSSQIAVRGRLLDHRTDVLECDGGSHASQFRTGRTRCGAVCCVSRTADDAPRREAERIRRWSAVGTAPSGHRPDPETIRPDRSRPDGGGQVALGCRPWLRVPPFDGSAPKRQQFPEPPAMGIDPNKRYTATLDTSLGEIVIALDAVKAPKTVNNFVFLALHHYYDGVIFHRIINGFMCQGGDPTGTGRGGPGYRFDDELPKAGQYQIGSVAMANAGPNTNGSQFFLDLRRRRRPPAAAVQPVRPDREGPRRARPDAAGQDRRPATVRSTTSSSTRSRSPSRTDRWARSTGARRSSPGPVAASARRSPSPSTPPAPGSPSSPAPPISSGDGAGLANDPVVIPADLGTPDGPGAAVATALEAFGGRARRARQQRRHRRAQGQRDAHGRRARPGVERQRPLGPAAGDAAVLPAMLAAGSGSIVSISSISGRRGGPAGRSTRRPRRPSTG